MLFFGFPVLLVGVYGVGVYYPSVASQFGGLSNIIPFITALLTYYYVLLTARMVRTMIHTQEESSRARVRLTIEFDEHEIFAVIRNLGGLPAYDLQVQFLPVTGNSSSSVTNVNNNSNQGATIEQPLFHDRPIAFMPPGYMIRTSLGFWTMLLKEGAPRDYSVILTYALTWKGKAISEEYAVNIPYFKRGASMAMADMNDLVRSVKGVGQQLENLERRLEPSRMHDMFYGPVQAIHLHNVDDLKEAARELLSAQGPESSKAPAITNDRALPNTSLGLRSRMKLALRVLMGIETL